MKGGTFRGRRADLVTAAAVAAILLSLPVDGRAAAPRLLFAGAARTVGGSCHVVETASARFAVDCGIFGPPNAPLPPDPGLIDFVVLTHAHLDHCGRLPELREAGFDGRVYCTPATAELAAVMLRMSGGFARDDGRSSAIEDIVERLSPVPFDRSFRAGGCRFTFVRAGHLLGAASVVARLPAKDDTVTVVFSGDIGGDNLFLAPPWGSIPRADYIVMESTYGATARKSAPGEERRRFLGAVSGTLAGGGDVLVPAFTLGKTQEVLALLQEAAATGTIPSGTLVWADSPTARKITAIYRRHPDDLSPRAGALGERLLRFPNLREVRSRTTMALHGRRRAPAVFVTSSGDLEFANAPRHLARMIDDEANLLCLVGWLAPGTLGARLRDGESPVLVVRREGRRTVREWMSPAIRVLSFDCFSGHADRNGLLAWLGRIEDVRRVFLVHGEEEAACALADTLRGRGYDAIAPRAGREIRLEPVGTRRARGLTGLAKKKRGAA